MNLSENAQQVIFGYLNKSIETPSLILETLLLINKEKQEKRLIVMTQYCVYLFISDKNTIVLDDMNYFYYITSIKKSKGRYRLKFADKSFIFVGQTAEIIAQMAVNLISNIFLEIEMNDVSSSLMPHMSCFPSILNRFLARMIAKKNVPPDNVIASFKKAINGIHQTFNLEQIESSDKYLDGILISLIIAPSIKHIIIPYSDIKKFWTIVANFAADTMNLEWITVSNQPEPYDEFQSFYSILCKTESLSFHKLEFKDVLFTEDMLRSLLASLNSRIVTDIVFNHCGFDMPEEIINEIFFNIRRRTKLLFIGFSTWNFEKRNELLKTICEIRNISLKGIDYEISKILESLQSITCQTLNLSSNKGILPVNDNIKLPTGLKKLLLNNIQWCGRNISRIIELCGESPNPIALELANAYIDSLEEQIFNNKIDNINPGSIEVFVWNNNTISKSVLNFLTRGENINFIGLAGIDIQNLNDKSFLKQIKAEFLDIHGTSTKLRDSIPEILDLLSNSQVKFINISHNEMGTYVLPQLVKVLQKYSNLKQIIIEDNNLDNLIKLRDFVTKMMSFKKLCIFFPWYEIYKLCYRSVPATAIDLQKYFRFPKYKLEPSLSADEWESSVKGYYPENDIANNIDNTQPIECPNSNYNQYEEEEEYDDSDIDGNPDIMNLDIIKPPVNIIEKLNNDVEYSKNIPQLFDALINSPQL